MHQIGVVGLSYRRAPVDEVAQFAVARAEVPSRLPVLQSLLNASERVYVGTCNRVELLYSTDDGTPAGDSRHGVFRILTGRDPIPGEAVRVRAWTGEAATSSIAFETHNSRSKAASYACRDSIKFRPPAVSQD